MGYPFQFHRDLFEGINMVMNQHSEARYIVESDNHEFIGRVYDLGGMVGLSFNSYDEIAILPDCLYAFEVDGWLSSLTRRVESMNLVGDMLWPECSLEVFEDFQYQSTNGVMSLPTFF